MMIRRVMYLATATLLLATGVANARVAPSQKCSVAKSQAATKKIAAKLKCHEKATSKALPVDPACLQKAEAKFNDAIAKAEKKGGCLVTGDGATIEGAVDSCVGSVLGLTAICGNTCDDSNACTTDSCDPVSGCQHAPLSGNACDDSNACTTDSCDPASGCQHAPQTGPACGTGGQCDDGRCFLAFPACSGGCSSFGVASGGGGINFCTPGLNNDNQTCTETSDCPANRWCVILGGGGTECVDGCAP